MRNVILGLAFAIFSVTVGTTHEKGGEAQAPQAAPAPKDEAPAELPSADSELAVALKHKYGGKFAVEDLDFIYYFTTYAIPETWKVKDEEVPLRQQAEQALPFVINSCASFKAEGNIEKPKRVPGSKTLWYIDIRDYGWSKEDVDAVFAIQPYFLAPLVYAKENSVIFRADWFIVNAMDVTKQDDRGLKDIAYYILQYGKGNEPKNAADFQKAWLVDIKTIREQRVETGTVVDAGDSGVSQHTRQLRRGRTVTGYYWETRDVKSHDLDPEKLKSRDFVEDIFANQADAGEYIASKKNGLQTYLLTAGNNDDFKEVKFGDPTIVVDRQDLHDPRVRTGKSCLVCHVMGIIPYTNAVRDLFRLGGDLRAKDKELARIIKAFYLRNDGSEVEDDNRVFERAIKQCNGLDPASNMKAYLNVYEWYWWQKLSLEQAAMEFGMDVPDYKRGIRNTTTGRLSFLFNGKGMPREIWDSINAGGYIQSALLIKRVDEQARKAMDKENAAKHRPADEENEDKAAPAPKPMPAPPMPMTEKKVEAEKPPQIVQVKVQQAALLDKQERVVVYLGYGVRVAVLRVYNEKWYYVRSGGSEGYLRKSETTPVRPSK